nr:MAG TPA: hypothetical protein [Caudoviricetes sp.]DAU58225.1 MAG TPA: hypothetical protein [Caudoviricetes sp.]
MKKPESIPWRLSIKKLKKAISSELKVGLMMGDGMMIMIPETQVKSLI